MMADGKTGLAAADDDRVELLSRVCISHDPCLTFCPGNPARMGPTLRPGKKPRIGRTTQPAKEIEWVILPTGCGGGFPQIGGRVSICGKLPSFPQIETRPPICGKPRNLRPVCARRRMRWRPPATRGPAS